MEGAAFFKEVTFIHCYVCWVHPSLISHQTWIKGHIAHCLILMNSLNRVNNFNLQNFEILFHSLTTSYSPITNSFLYTRYIDLNLRLRYQLVLLSYLCYIVHHGNTSLGTTETLSKWWLYYLQSSKGSKRAEKEIPSLPVTQGGQNCPGQVQYMLVLQDWGREQVWFLIYLGGGALPWLASGAAYSQFLGLRSGKAFAIELTSLPISEMVHNWKGKGRWGLGDEHSICPWASTISGYQISPTSLSQTL